MKKIKKDCLHCMSMVVCGDATLLSVVKIQVESSLVPRPCTPPGEKQSGKQSPIPWASSPKVGRTNEIVRLVIVT